MFKIIIAFLALLLCSPAMSAGRWVQTPYKPAKVVFEFYLDQPEKIASALFWVRSLMNPLQDAPYNYAPEELDIKVVIHGTEIVTVAKHHQQKYQDIVERMRYYADLGVEFKVCGLAAEDFGYSLQDFHDFIQVVPNAITELAHWQQQGYALIKPEIFIKQRTLESIR